MVAKQDADRNFGECAAGVETLKTESMMSLLGAFVETPRPENVWLKGRIVPGYDPSVWRQDEYGSWIRYSDYGDRSSEYGWEIDHRRPSAFGGSDSIDNCRPLHWRRNASLGALMGGLLSGFTSR
jgi:hypothetical protein